MGMESMSYEQMVHEIGEDKFSERLDELQETANAFIANAGFSSCVECNQRILLQIQLDYFSDIFRLKDFHGIEKVRTEKIFAYTVFWILKRKPLQIIKYSDTERDIFVNERFAIYLMLNECLLKGDKVILDEKNTDKFTRYIDLLLYYFKYRETNAQVIELLIESFKMGSVLGENAKGQVT